MRFDNASTIFVVALPKPLFKFKLFLFEVNQMQYVYIFIGGALGALLRYLISFLNTDGGFPIGTLIANLTGAFVMGLLTALTIAFFQTIRA